MTTNQKEMLLNLIAAEAEKNYPDGNYNEWNDIYWQVVKIETEEK